MTVNWKCSLHSDCMHKTIRKTTEKSFCVAFYMYLHFYTRAQGRSLSPDFTWSAPGTRTIPGGNHVTKCIVKI